MSTSSARQSQAANDRPVVLFGALVAAGAAASLWTAGKLPGPSFDVAATTGFAVAFLAARLLTLQLPQGDRVRVSLVVGVVALCLRATGEVLVAASAAALLDRGGACVAEWRARRRRSSCGTSAGCRRAGAVVTDGSCWHTPSWPQRRPAIWFSFWES